MYDTGMRTTEAPHNIVPSTESSMKNTVIP